MHIKGLRFKSYLSHQLFWDFLDVKLNSLVYLSKDKTKTSTIYNTIHYD